jgi:flagellar assembly protein FliH
MTGFVPKEHLTAYQRWEVAAFDEAKAAAAEAMEGAPAPAVEESPLVLPTAAEIERMHVEAHEEGYAAGRAEGYAEGHAAGHAEGLAMARESAARIDEAMAGLRDALASLDQHVAEQLLATAVEIANQVLRQSLRLKPELILPVVREAVATLHPNFGHPALFLCPDDAALVRTHLGDQLAHNNWRIIEDPALARGGCRVEAGASEVDATLETRWRRAIEQIGISQEWLADKP